MSGTTTLIRGGWIVAFDGDRHRILTDGVVVYRDDSIVYVGRSWEEPVDVTVDARRHLVMPGLINAHAHVGAHTGDRMILDGGRVDLFRSGFMNYCTTKGIDGPTVHDYENVDAAIRYSLACLLRFGSTTVVDMGSELGGEPGSMATHAGELGIRLYTAPGMRSAHHYYDQSGRHQIHWHDDDGLATLESALAFVETWDGAYDGRVRAILVPLEYHLSSAELLHRTKEAAARHGIGITMHVAESVLEDPMAVLLAQRDKARDELVTRMKDEGVDYEERMARLAEVTWPKPEAEFIEPAFEVFARHHPWVGHLRPSPKSVVRDMVEHTDTFNQYVSRYGLKRSEGLVLRYLTDCYKALAQTVPTAAVNDRLAEVIEWLGALVREVDSSLLDEWERLRAV